MKRWRALCGVLGLTVVLASPLTASAQGAGRPLSVIGLLDAGERLEWWAAFRQQIGELGYVEGKTVAFEQRFAGGSYERLPTMAQELVRLKVSVIVTSGSAAAEVAKRVTSSVPIVLATGDDPVGAGLVASFARPGGNITGVTSISTGLTGKRLQILRESFPKLSRLAALWHRDNAASARQVQELQSAARAAKVALQVLGVKSSDEFPAAFSAMTQERAQAVFVISDPFVFNERRRLAELTLEHRLPSMHGPSEYVDAGGLISYAPSYLDLFRRAAIYVDKILKGAKPADLPIEQPITFDLVINLKTAKALGVTMPRALLLRANRVIE